MADRDRELDASGITSLVTVELESGGTEYGRLFVRPDGLVYYRSLVEIETDYSEERNGQSA